MTKYAHPLHGPRKAKPPAASVQVAISNEMDVPNSKSWEAQIWLSDELAFGLTDSSEAVIAWSDADSLIEQTLFEAIKHFGRTGELKALIFALDATKDPNAKPIATALREGRHIPRYVEEIDYSKFDADIQGVTIYRHPRARY